MVALAPLATPKRVISARARVINAALAFWPLPRPSEMPQAMPTTFFSAPPICTPAMSSLPYTLNRSPMKAACASRTRPASGPAITVAAGSPAAISAEKLGPESAQICAGADATVRDHRRHQPAAVRLQPLRRADNGRGGPDERLDALDVRLHARGRHRYHDDRGGRQRVRPVTCLQAGGKAQARPEALVLPVRPQAARFLHRTTKQKNVMAVFGQEGRQGRAPGPGPDDRYRRDLPPPRRSRGAGRRARFSAQHRRAAAQCCPCASR